MDDGATWTQLAIGLTSTSYSWDTSTVPNGLNFRIKVVATCSEGMTAEHISEPFSVQNSTPTSITSTSSDTSPSMGSLMLLLSLVTLVISIRRIKNR